MFKIIIDARRKLNNGIGRVTQWLVDNLSEDTFSNTELWYLTSDKCKNEYSFRPDRILISKEVSLSVDNILDTPARLLNDNFDLYINPLVTTSPFQLIPTISLIYDFWALTHNDWLPTIKDLLIRINNIEMHVMQKVINWLDAEKANMIFTDEGFSIWKHSLSYNNPVMNYTWSHTAAMTLFSSHICFCSLDTKREFYKIFKRKANISIIPLGMGADWRNIELKDGKHFLAVSKLEPRKNIHGLLDAYEMYAANNKNNIPLIIVGDPGYSIYASTVIQRINVLRENGLNIQYIGSVSDAQLYSLYSETVALLYPTLFEGYGLPPLEAMAAGVPVVSSMAGISHHDVSDYINVLNSNTPLELSQIMRDITENTSKYKSKALICKNNNSGILNNDDIKEKWITLINSYMKRSKHIAK